MSDLYESLECALVHAQIVYAIHPDVFVCLYKLFQQGKNTFLPWYDYNRICCDQCYEEILRGDHFTSDLCCIFCAKTPILNLSESISQYDQLCLVRYREMVRDLLPLVREEIRKIQRINQLLYNDWGIVTSKPNDSTDLDFPLPVD